MSPESLTSDQRHFNSIWHCRTTAVWRESDRIVRLLRLTGSLNPGFRKSEVESARRSTLQSSMRALLLLAPVLAIAQDTRHVVEPAIPPICATVKAQLPATLPDESRLDTARIQGAIDQCPTSRAVELKADGASRAFLSGPLQLKNGVTLLVDAGVILFASRNPRDYDTAPGRCGTTDDSGKGCKPLIGGDGISDAAVMGEGVIDGRGGAKLIGASVSWWDLAEEARVKNNHQNVPRLIVMSHARNFTLYRITLKDSPNFHVVFGGDGFTAWGVTIHSPKNARNTDGIDPINATNVTITHCFIHAGDDEVAIKANGAPATNMTIAQNHFYTGHGMSIGSETFGGVSAIRVSDLSIDGSDNGLRIKSNSSRGGLVHDVIYEDVCIQNTKNPIYMDSNYSFREANQDKPPTYREILFRNVHILSGGKLTFDGLDSAHRLGMTLSGATAREPVSLIARHADFVLGPGPVDFKPSGEDVHVTAATGRFSATGCEGKFVPLPLK
jgi:polygalacturonase